MAVEVNSFGVPIDSETGYGVSEPRNEASLEEIRNRLPDLYDDNSLLRKQMRSNGIFQPSDMRYWDKFYRFKRIDPHFWIDGGQEYLFFTRPELHIMNTNGLYKTDYYDTTITGHQISSNVNKVQQVINDVSQAISNFIGDRTKSNTSTVAAPGGTAVIPYFQHLYNTNYKNTVLKWLNDDNSAKSPFLNILSNRKTSNMDIPDIVTQEIETAQNMYGTRIFYPTSSMKSDEDTEFNIEFEDTQHLEIYHLFKAWDMYRQAKYLGIVAPDVKFIKNKILHDQISIYKFIVDTDGETLLYWAKATGVYPKTISRSAFSEIQEKGQVKITVNFKLSGWFEDMELNIITEFNRLVAHYMMGTKSPQFSTKEVPIYNTDILGIDNDNVDFFYIEECKYSDSSSEALAQVYNPNNYTKFKLKAGRF